LNKLYLFRYRSTVYTLFRTLIRCYRTSACEAIQSPMLSSCLFAWNTLLLKQNGKFFVTRSSAIVRQQHVEVEMVVWRSVEMTPFDRTYDFFINVQQ